MRNSTTTICGPVLFVTLAAVFVCSWAGRASAEDVLADAESFAESYRQQKRAERKEKILNVLRPSEKNDAQRTQEFMARSFYDEAAAAYRQKDYQRSRGKLEELHRQIAESSLPEASRRKWTKRADELGNKIIFQEERQRQKQEEQKVQPVKKKKARKIVEKTVKPEPIKSVAVATQPPGLPSVDSAQRESIMGLLKQRKQEIQFKRDVLQKEFSQGLEKMYDHALERYKAKDHTAAKMVFEDIQELSPNYKDTGKYLKRLDRLAAQE